MSDEEKKAIERLKLFEYRYVLVQNDDKVIGTILNLIEKQQKEIEENQILIDDIRDHRIVYIDTPEFEEKFVSKDKIKEKIKKAKEIKWQIPKLVIEYFEELLEENDE